MQGEIWRRSRQLVAFLVGALVDADPEPVRLPDLLAEMQEIEHEGRPKWSRKTIENTIRDLSSFGAIRVADRGRDRVVSITVMGLAWRAGVVIPRLSDFNKIEEAYQEVLAWYDESDDVIDRAILDECEDWAPEVSDEQLAELTGGGYDEARAEADRRRAEVVAEVERQAEEIAAALTEHLPEGYEAGFDPSPLLSGGS